MNTAADDVIELEQSLCGVHSAPPSSTVNAAIASSNHTHSSPKVSFRTASEVQTMNATICSSSNSASVINNSPLAQAAPAYEFKNERAEHRIILEYIAKGYTDVEIAELVGRSAPMIGYVRKQPRYQAGLLNDIKRKLNEDQEVVQFIRENVVKAVETLAQVMNATDARNSDRIAAAEALLNRRYGKPNQPVNAGNTVDLNHLSDADLAKMLPETNGTTTSASV